ncbi:MAG: hypothetical protein PWP10_4368 [Clostridiales bacterium]|jgi:capsular polysaccharide biosynthesis protein|nr:hypothetical protein [Clostridiales bacterium]
MENTTIGSNNYEEISLRELLETIWKGKALIAIITAVAIILTVVASFVIMDEKYEASVTLRTSPIKMSSTYSGEEAAAFADLESKLTLTPAQYAEYMSNLDFLDILAAETNLTTEDGQQMTGEQIGGLITTTADDKTSLVEVTVTGTEPAKVYAIAGKIETSFVKYINDFVNENIELYNASLQDNIDLAKDALATKEAELNDFRRTNGSIELLSDEVSRLQSRISELNSNIDLIDSELAGDIASLDTLTEELKDANALDESQLKIVGELKQAITEDAGNELDSDFYIETDLNSNNGQISQSVRLLELSRLQMRLLNNYNKKAADIRQLEETEILYQDKQQELLEIQPIYTNYKSEYDIALSTYTSYMKRISASKVYAELDVASTFVTQMAAPVEPKAPVSPNKMLNLAIGLVLGLMLGVFVVFFREYWKNSAVK